MQIWQLWQHGILYPERQAAVASVIADAGVAENLAERSEKAKLLLFA